MNNLDIKYGRRLCNSLQLRHTHSNKSRVFQTSQIFFVLPWLFANYTVPRRTLAQMNLRECQHLQRLVFVMGI